jgi:hypothetical protein
MGLTIGLKETWRRGLQVGSHAPVNRLGSAGRIIRRKSSVKAMFRPTAGPRIKRRPAPRVLTFQPSQGLVRRCAHRMVEEIRLVIEPARQDRA